MSKKWDERYLQMACLIASWSKDPKQQVGCVLTDERNRIVATGYNGLSSGIDEYNEEDRLALTLHAEENAIFTSNRNFHTAYVWPYLPCSLCAARLAQAGVQRIVSKREPPVKWKPELTRYICDKKQIEVVLCL